MKRLFGKRRDRKHKLRHDLAAELIDLDWYTMAHGLSGERSQILSHCADIALTLGLSPRESMAAEDGISLAPWAFAALRRQGVEFRAPSHRALDLERDGALEPRQARNERGVDLAVVTSIIGAFDALPIMPAAFGERADFFVVTDRAFEPFSLWRPLVCNYSHPNPRIRSRFAKANLSTLLTGYNWLLWVDGNVCLLVDPAEILAQEASTDVDAAFFAHGDRFSIVGELEACRKYGKDENARMMDEVGANMPTGYRDDLLVFGSIFLARGGRTPVDAFFAEWWRMIQKGSQRDQLSLPIALRGQPELNWRLMPGHPNQSPYFKKFNH